MDGDHKLGVSVDAPKPMGDGSFRCQEPFDIRSRGAKERLLPGCLERRIGAWHVSGEGAQHVGVDLDGVEVPSDLLEGRGDKR